LTFEKSGKEKIMKIIKKIFFVIFGLILIYFLIESVWNLLNIQLCSSKLPKNATCEQIAENNSKNCKYLILRWKRVDYSSELKDCQEWERKQQK
jgi:hypothetical protein